MSSKEKIRIILILFILGILFVFYGFSLGEDIATLFSKINGVMAWITSENKLKACTYTPVFIGLYFLIASLILIFKWIEDIQSELFK